MKENVYVETSIVSYLTSRMSKAVIVAARQEITREWWRLRSQHFELVISEMVYQEASGGDPDAARARINMIDGLRILRTTDEAFSLAERLISKGPIPRQYSEDALHISVAAVNGVDYLLTWNCKHIANASHRGIVEVIVERAGYACPVICTPEELMEDY